MKKPKYIYFFDNGNVAVMDEYGKQIPELQKSWLRQWFDQTNITLSEMELLEIRMPDGRYAKIIIQDDDYNWNKL